MLFSYVNCYIGIFGAIESAKVELQLQGYSVSQTSLEQIFNQFAAQQEEEKLHGRDEKEKK
jgi:hypothetical protein